MYLVSRRSFLYRAGGRQDNGNISYRFGTNFGLLFETIMSEILFARVVPLSAIQGS